MTVPHFSGKLKYDYVWPQAKNVENHKLYKQRTYLCMYVSKLENSLKQKATFLLILILVDTRNTYVYLNKFKII